MEAGTTLAMNEAVIADRPMTVEVVSEVGVGLILWLRFRRNSTWLLLGGATVGLIARALPG